MAGADALISEKRKRSGKESVTSRRAPSPILTPPPLSPQISSSSSRRQAGKRRTHLRSATVSAATASGQFHLLPAVAILHVQR
jgi:hypothetical protein